MISLLSFLITLVILAALLQGAAKITGNNTKFGTFFLIALVGAICSAIPMFGFLIGLVVVLIMLVTMAKMSILSAILTVILAYVLAFIITMGIGALLGLGMWWNSNSGGTAGTAAMALLLALPRR